MNPDRVQKFAALARQHFAPTCATLDEYLRRGWSVEKILGCVERSAAATEFPAAATVLYAYLLDVSPEFRRREAERGAVSATEERTGQ